MRILISDYHAGCQLWQAALLEKLGNNIIINSLSGHSFLIDENKKQNIIVDANKILNVHNIQPVLSELDKVNVKLFDTVLVSFPPKFIDLYKNVKLKYPKILNAGHRLHIHTKHDKLFINSLIEQTNNKEIILCSMSKYDTEYIKHYLNITPIELYVTCFHIPEHISYKPIRHEILISPVHATSVAPFKSILDMNQIAKDMGFNLIFSNIKSLYNHFKYEDLVNHKATVLFPYSAFSISMIEIYEMNIPMFVPSKRLLIETGIMNDISLFPCYSSYEEMINIDIPHNESPHKYSPNSMKNEDRLYWLDFTYFNTKENVIYWDNPVDLFNKLISTNLQEVSNRMKTENIKHREKQLNNWKNLLESFNDLGGVEVHSS